MDEEQPLLVRTFFFRFKWVFKLVQLGCRGDLPNVPGPFQKHLLMVREAHWSLQSLWMRLAAGVVVRHRRMDGVFIKLVAQHTRFTHRFILVWMLGKDLFQRQLGWKLVPFRAREELHWCCR